MSNFVIAVFKNKVGKIFPGRALAVQLKLLDAFLRNTCG
jgi:hypothetical protein